MDYSRLLTDYATLPSSLKIGHLLFKVERKRIPPVEKGHLPPYGLSSESSQFIAIQPNLSPDRERETFLHEILHCALRSQDLLVFVEHEEMLVRGLARILAQVLADNPDLLEYYLLAPEPKTEKVKRL